MQKATTIGGYEPPPIGGYEPPTIGYRHSSHDWRKRLSSDNSPNRTSVLSSFCGTRSFLSSEPVVAPCGVRSFVAGPAVSPAPASARHPRHASGRLCGLIRKRRTVRTDEGRARLDESRERRRAGFWGRRASVASAQARCQLPSPGSVQPHTVVPLSRLADEPAPFSS